MARIRCLGVLLCLGIALSVQDVAARRGCQNQECHYTQEPNDCYVCQGLTGTMCQVTSCGNCIESACAGGDGPVLAHGRLSWGATRVVSKTCVASNAVRVANVTIAGPAEPLQLTELLAVPSEGISLNFFRQDDAPASFVEIQFGRPQAFNGGKIVNFSEKELVAVRIGWMLASPSGRTFGYTSKRISLKEAAGRFEEQSLPPQTIPDLSSIKTPARLMFFVAEVEFRDGSLWKENVGQIGLSADAH